MDRASAGTALNGFQCLPEDSSRILWVLNSQLFLEASISTDLIDEGKVATEIAAKQFCCCPADACRLLAREQHNYLNNATCVCHGCLLLAPSTTGISEFDVKAFCFNVGVTRGEATEVFCCLVLVFARDQGGDIYD